jgi:hypothetical protein
VYKKKRQWKWNRKCIPIPPVKKAREEEGLFKLKFDAVQYRLQ